MEPEPLLPSDPREIGGYRVVGRLGNGGMGVVYAAVDTSGRRVAVKLVHDHLAVDLEFRRRFSREVRVLREVEGACLARVLDSDPGAERPWLATEFIPGLTLEQHVLRHGPLTGDPLYGLAAGLAEALMAMHAAGVVHRDLKPSNVILSPEGPRVIDFGIAKVVDGTSVTHTGTLIGSPGWISPEEYGDGPVGTAADVYGWGLLVLYAASGEPPYGTGRPEVLAVRVLKDRPDLEPVPEDLRDLVRRAIAKDPAERPLAADLLAGVVECRRDAWDEAENGGERPGEDDAASAVTALLLQRTWVLPPEEAPDWPGAGTPSPGAERSADGEADAPEHTPDAAGEASPDAREGTEQARDAEKEVPKDTAEAGTPAATDAGTGEPAATGPAAAERPGAEGSAGKAQDGDTGESATKVGPPGGVAARRPESAVPPTVPVGTVPAQAGAARSRGSWLHAYVVTVAAITVIAVTAIIVGGMTERSTPAADPAIVPHAAPTGPASATAATGGASTAPAAPTSTPSVTASATAQEKPKQRKKRRPAGTRVSFRGITFTLPKGWRMVRMRRDLACIESPGARDSDRIFDGECRVSAMAVATGSGANEWPGNVIDDKEWGWYFLGNVAMPCLRDGRVWADGRTYVTAPYASLTEFSLRRMADGRRAAYREWSVTCADFGYSMMKIWHLPKSKVSLYVLSALDEDLDDLDRIAASANLLGYRYAAPV